MGNSQQQQFSSSSNEGQNYIEAVKAIKQAILQSRYKAAVLANGEMLSLYFGVGKYVSQNSRNGFWGTSAIETISNQLQNELPGLRGFSATNIRLMRLFYESWDDYFVNHQLTTDDLKSDNLNHQLLTDDSQISIIELLTFRQLTNGDFKDDFISDFLKIGFTNHSEILSKTKTIGILLCTEQKKKTVEFALRDFNKPMGVATYKTAEELPEEYREVFRNLEEIKKLL